MSEESTLEFEVDRVGPADSAQPVARVFVSGARAFTRHTGAPILTADCADLETFESEVERLQEELAAALAAARAYFGSEAPDAGRKRADAPPQPSHSAERAHVDLGLLVEDVMTRDVKTVGRNEPLTLVDELMKVGRFRHVVVLEEDGGLCGVISHRDIFLGALAWSLGQARHAHERALAATPAKDVMQGDPITIDPGAPLTEAAARMAEHKVGCLPVVHGGRLVGILTEGDFLALLSRRGV